MAPKGKHSAADIGWTPERSVAGKHNPWTIIGVISIATFMVVLDSSIANVALAHIAGNLSASYDEAAWVLTSFLVANAVVIPISGWLADVVGRKRYYMISVALFTLSSLLCGLAPTLPFLIIARILQGIGGGGLAPVEQSMMADTFPPSKRGAAFAVYGIVVIVGPILGPTLGGWITDNYSWHWVFLINVPIGILSLCLVAMFVDEPPALVKRAKELTQNGLKIDFIGFALIALFLSSMEVTMDRGQRDDWFSSPMITSFAILGGLALVAFIPWELTRKDPIVRIDLFKRANFAISNIFMLLVGMILFGTTQFIPQLLQEVMGYTATQAGEALTLGGIATILMMPAAGLLTGKVDARILIGIALVIQGVALWNMSTLDAMMSFQSAAVARTIQAVGMPLMFVPISTVAYVGLKPQENNQASALMNVSRNLGGTLGISFAQTMLARQAQIHQSQMAETLNPLNPNYRQAVTGISHALMGQGVSQADAGRAAGAVLYRTLGQQAAMLSYIDVFHIMMWMVFICLPLVLLMRVPKSGQAPAGAAP
jgi:MFS transporter, DHA2 family, multidrug resistance protein